MAVGNMDEPRREHERLLVVIATMVINVITVSLLTFAPRSDWRTGAALNFVDKIVCSLGLQSLGVTHCLRAFFFLAL